MKHIEEILKKKGIITASPEDTLAQVLGKLASAHDAAFIFDEEKKFLGVINPYHTTIKTSAFDGSTKVKHALFHPPHIHEKDSLERIVTLMNESKIHYLPVFNDTNEFLGITSARRILSFMLHMEIAQTKIKKMAHTQKGKVLTVLMTDPVSKAMALFKEYKTSKIVVVDKAGKLKGILSHYDLIPYLVAPVGKSEYGQRGDHHNFKETPVKNFVKSSILMLNEENTIGDAIHEIISKEIGSIILVDHDMIPTGIVTTRDITDMLREDRKIKHVEVTTQHLSKAHEPTVGEFVRHIKKMIQGKEGVKEGLIIIHEEKNGALFQVHVHLIPEKGNPTVITREGKDLSMTLQKVKDVVRRT